RDLAAEYFPPSPDVASLGTYSEYPIDHSSGLANISLPLYTIKEGDIEIPIVLNYHGAGFRVEEEASWVGLGWSISAEGAIHRKINGAPDESGFGVYFPTPDAVQEETDMDNSDQSVPSYAFNSIYQPDQFSFNAPGISGGFVLGNDRQPICVPFKEYKVTRSLFSTFTVTTPTGVAYSFNKGDETHNGLAGTTETSSWKLWKITDRNENEVLYTYGNLRHYFHKYVFQQSITSTKASGGGCLGSGGFGPEVFGNLKSSNNFTSVKTRHLQEIRFSDGRVVFHTSGREDVDQNTSAGPGLEKLDSISIEAKVGTTTYRKVKVFKFMHGYFNSGTQTTYEYKRLKLLEVFETGVAPDGKREGRSIAEYHYNETTNLPPKNSLSRDSWGYFNDKSNSNLIPRNYYFNTVPQLQYIGGADRRPVEAKMKANILTKVVYPTSGSVSFEYEANRYKGVSYPGDWTAHHSVALGKGDPSQTPPLMSPYGCEQDTNYTCSFSNFTVNKDQTMGIRIYCNYYGNDPLGDKYGYVDYSISAGGNDVSGIWKVSSSNTSETIYGILSADKDDEVTVSIIVYGTGFHGSVWVDYEDVVELPYTIAGGLRIKKQIVQESSGAPLREITYEYTDENNDYSGYLSSGTARSDNVGSYDNHELVSCSQESGASTHAYLTTTHRIFASYPVNQNGIQTSTVAYSDVKVRNTVNGVAHGYTHYKYQRSEDYPAVGSLVGPSRPGVSNAADRKKIKGMVVYDANGYKQEEDVYQYEDILDVKPPVIGFYFAFASKANPWPSGGSYTSGYPLNSPNTDFEVQPTNYEHNIDWNRLAYKTKTQYFNNEATSVSQTETYTYAPVDKGVESPVLTETTDSRNEVRRSGSIFPKWFESPNGTSTITNTMISEDLLTLPIYQYQEIGTGSPTTLAASFNEYKLDQHGHINPYKVYKLEAQNGYPANGSVTLTDEVLSSGSATSSLKPKVIYDQYGERGNPLEMHRQDGQYISVLWDDFEKSPIAKVQNSQYADAAFTSFELNASGKMVFNQNAVQSSTEPLPGGSYYYQLNSGVDVVTLNNLNSSREYRLSFWVKEGTVSVNSQSPPLLKTNPQEWELREIIISGVTSITIDGTAKIDEVRLCPSSALMTTYNHIPLVSVQSVTDPRNETQYYSYDPYGRLIVVKDSDGHILKKNEYHYKP
ncbi:MAG: hypothetical protein ACPF9D_05940, partial [Owenweeksia sp.]